VSDGTKIEWTDATLNVVNGCSVVSPGCTNCYAMRLAGTRMRHHPSRQGLTVPSKAGPVWNGTVRFNDKALLQPLRWKRPRKIFWNAHGDLFHEKVPDEWIDRCFAVMALTPHHIHQVLTKRPERMRDYLTLKADERNRPAAGFKLGRGGKVWQEAYHVAAKDFGREAAFTEALQARGMPTQELPWPLHNVWLGTSVEDQQRADERIPILLDTPAAVRWLSCEPLLGPVDLSEWLVCQNWSDDIPMDMTTGLRECCAECDYTGIAGFSGLPIVDWVVAGGESGPGARPMHPDWARSLRDQCDAAAVPFLFKQWGNWAPDEGPPPIGKDKIFEGSAKAAVMVDGAWRYLDNGFQGPIEWCGRSDNWLFNVGKKAGGRALDGVQHDGYPA
jgi:protein gp37